ncbi:hypothetical protein [uncultured Actinomyces sp.]|uniref:phage tail protein n=1 Tax=uncultured Actinomyces sp. TaxID=249061 RepID=UPI00261D6EC1|nr:hypothetical protein [uncultured Actinomyces sp.]
MVSSVEIAKPESTHETNPLKDAGIVSDIRDLYISKSALDATLSTIGIAADLVDMAVNPIKTAVSWAVNWIISHIDPLPDMLQQFTGDPEKVEAAALTWERIGDQWTQAAAELEAAVAAGLDAQVCRTLSAYKVQIGSVIEAFRSLGDACKVVAQCLNILSAMVKIVYDLTREAIGDLIGTFVQSVWEAVGTLGIATPAIVTQISATVSKWVARITTKGKQVLNGFREALKSFTKLDGILEKLGPALKKLFSHVGDLPDKVHDAWKAGKGKVDDLADGAKDAWKAGKDKLGDLAEDAWKAGKDKVDDLADGAKDAWKAGKDKLGDLAEDAWKAGKDKVDDLADGIEDAWKAGKDKVDDLADGIEDAWKAGKDKVDDLADGVHDAFESGARKVGDFVDDPMAAMKAGKDKLGDLAEDAWKAGKDKVDDLADGVQDAWKAGKDKVDDLADGVQDAWKSGKRKVGEFMDDPQAALKAGKDKLDDLADDVHDAVERGVKESARKAQEAHQATIDLMNAPSEAAESLGKEGVRAWYRRFGTSEQVAGVDEVLKREELFDLPMKRQREWIGNLNDNKELFKKGQDVYKHWGLPSQNEKDD